MSIIDPDKFCCKKLIIGESTRITSSDPLMNRQLTSDADAATCLLLLSTAAAPACCLLLLFAADSSTACFCFFCLLLRLLLSAVGAA